MQPCHVPLAISAPLVIAGYGWLYTSDLFWGSDAHPERAGEAAEAAAQCPIAPAVLAHASAPWWPELVE